MIKTATNAIIHYQHTAEEIAELADAIVSLDENIRAAGSQSERALLRNILHGEKFRYRDARIVCKMLERAAKHAKANVGNYFPEFQQDILFASENLENAAKRYWAMFEDLVDVTAPTH